MDLTNFNYRKGLADMPSYDVVERDWDIKINANECNMNMPPLVAERVMSRLSCVAFNRYPNEEYDSLREQIARNFQLQKENVLIGSGSSEIIEKLFYCFGGSPEQKIVYPQRHSRCTRFMRKLLRPRAYLLPFPPRIIRLISRHSCARSTMKRHRLPSSAIRTTRRATLHARPDRVHRQEYFLPVPRR